MSYNVYAFVSFVLAIYFLHSSLLQVLKWIFRNIMVHFKEQHFQCESLIITLAILRKFLKFEYLKEPRLFY